MINEFYFKIILFNEILILILIIVDVVNVCGGEGITEWGHQLKFKKNYTHPLMYPKKKHQQSKLLPLSFTKNILNVHTLKTDFN